jgi:hypothetical protein
MRRAAVNPSMGAAGKTFRALAILLRAESRWFAFLANPARRMRLALFFTPRRMTSRPRSQRRDNACPLRSNIMSAASRL